MAGSTRAGSPGLTGSERVRVVVPTAYGPLPGTGASVLVVTAEADVVGTDWLSGTDRLCGIDRLCGTDRLCDAAEVVG
jgi:hypothetical protein